jgi:hypothetical protein
MDFFFGLFLLMLLTIVVRQRSQIKFLRSFFEEYIVFLTDKIILLEKKLEENEQRGESRDSGDSRNGTGKTQ